MEDLEPPSKQTPRISVVFPYYDNPEMLKFQLDVISQYSRHVAERVEVIIVDDASPLFPASEILRDLPIRNVRTFRILRDKPWNQDAARNVGAFEAAGDYLLLTDIDHVVPESTLLELEKIADEDRVFTLGRKSHFSEKVVPSHVNSYFLSRSLFWSVGGYDEDFWGAYGSDVLFRRRLVRRLEVVELPEVRLELVTRGAVSDAKNVSLERVPSMARRIRTLWLRTLKRLGLRAEPVALVNPYTRHS